MEFKITPRVTQCAACHWYLYKDQPAPFRATGQLRNGIEQIEFYCSEKCYANPEPRPELCIGPVS